MNQLNYSPVPRRTRESILESLRSTDAKDIRDALISAAYWDEDWQWAQEQLLNFSTHADEGVLGAVALGFGFIAVFHGDIDERTVMPVLARLKQRPELRSFVEETEAEIDHFVRRRRMGEDISLGKRLPPDWRPGMELK